MSEIIMGVDIGYGNTKGRELIIAAINAYSRKEDTSSDMNIDIERLADYIVNKMKNNGITPSIYGEDVPGSESSNADIFDKALSFMESL